MKTYYAHSLPDRSPEDWQPLEEHLRNVAKRAREFAEPFGGGDWAYLAGLWHDLGKYSDAFQARLLTQNGIDAHIETHPGRVIHSQAGAHLATLRGWHGEDRILSWLIMGHHAGLADYYTDQTGAKALEPKMETPKVSKTILEHVPDEIRDYPKPPPPTSLLDGADVSFFIRMLFSCVVDADFLDTEAFMDSERSLLREKKIPSLEELSASFDEYMELVLKEATPSPVNAIRANVLNQCRMAAESKPDVFSLTVPTGGGKTLSSMAFALRHAVKWGKRRVIYIIPYTSIIEQTAEVFRSIPGFESAVLEHHCNVSEAKEEKENRYTRLIAENWDAPIVVTTTVQFFESLYGCKTSRCRKLHNIADSVVIFDEAQCLPPDYLRPCVFAIRELQQHYGVTPILCTATQPVLTKTDQFDFHFREGFEHVTPIIPGPDKLFMKLKRVNIRTLNNLDPVENAELAESMLAREQSVLCIVNRKLDAYRLAKLLPKEQTIHLSTNMCAEHRLEKLHKIRQRLSIRKTPLLVVSTSLVEAGVDLDFPVVYRALAGLDSIAQAAGRCNREGALEGRGETFVFLPAKQPDYIRGAASLTTDYLKEKRIEQALQPETFDAYFRQRFFQLGHDALDAKGILHDFAGNLDFYFRTAANKFRLINDDWQLPLIVPYGNAREFVDELVAGYENTRLLFRKLRRFTVSIPKYLHAQLHNEGHIHEVPNYPGVFMLDTDGLYTSAFGFVSPDEMDGYEPETMIV